MTQAADLVLKNGEVHTLTDPDRTEQAVAVRDGEVVRVDEDYEVRFLEGVETRVVDLDGRVLLPGFVDAHTHMEQLGTYQVHADLAAADSLRECRRLLEAEAADAAGVADDWVLGFGYDESEWSDERRYPTREDLDAVSETRPVAAVRVDMHTASLNSAALSRLRDSMPETDVQTEDGDPTGVVVEDAVEALRDAIAPDREETRALLLAAQAYALERGVTCVHDIVRDSHAPRVYRDLDVEGALDLRVRINYWSDHLDAVEETGLRTNHGSEFVRTGAIKTFTDGSFGGQTAKLSEPYADGDRTGTWVVSPDELGALVERVEDADLQLMAHAIGDEAVEAALTAFEATDAPGESRHRTEHAELATDEHIARLADSGVVASVQPNFLRWAGENGLYDQRLGEERRRQTNRFARMLDAGVDLAFGSDCMPLGPLYGVHQVVNAPTSDQRLSVTDALRAYTSGGAYAGFDEDRLGTIEVGKKADFVVLDRSPWEDPDGIEDISVAMTVVDGTIVYDDR